MKRTDRVAIFLMIVCLILHLMHANEANALAGDSEGVFGLDGSVRTIGAVFGNKHLPRDLYSKDYDNYLQAVLRLTAIGRPSDFFSYEVHLVNAYTYSSSPLVEGASTPGLSGGKSRYRAVDETWKWMEREDSVAYGWFDRFSAKWSFDWMDLIIGRQAMTFGKAYFWNPLDVFLPFDPAQFDRDYKPGVDAVRIDAPFGLFSGFTLVYALGREIGLNGEYDAADSFDASWYGSALLARVYTNAAGWDFALQGGKIYGGRQLGGALTGEVSGIQVRMESAYFWPDDGPVPLPGIDLFEEHLCAVVGFGYRFENSLDLEFEFLYNDGGEDENIALGLLRRRYNAALQAGRYIAGLTATYEFTPLLNGRLTWIYSLSDGSSLVQPYLTFSLSNNADLIMGAGLNQGDGISFNSLTGLDAGSEFGSQADVYFMELKWYF